MLLNCGVGEDSWVPLGQLDLTSPSWRKAVLNIHWNDWCWSWNSKLWPPDVKSWLIGKDRDAGKERRQEEKGTNRGWDGGMASPTWRTWVWVNSGRRWRTRKPGVLQSMGSQRVRHSWVTELHWTKLFSLPHWQVDSLPLCHPKTLVLKYLSSKMRTLRTRDAKQLVQAHAAVYWQSCQIIIQGCWLVIILGVLNLMSIIIKSKHDLLCTFWLLVIGTLV